MASVKTILVTRKAMLEAATQEGRQACGSATFVAAGPVGLINATRPSEEVHVVDNEADVPGCLKSALEREFVKAESHSAALSPQESAQPGLLSHTRRFEGGHGEVGMSTSPGWIDRDGRFW